MTKTTLDHGSADTTQPTPAAKSGTSTPAWSPLPTAFSFVLGNLLPSVGLLLMLRGTPMPASWQSGALHDYVTFLLSGEVAALFYPFFFYSIACFTLGLFRPDIATRLSFVRFGIYSGILLALQYWFIVCIVAMRIDDVGTWQALLSMVLGIPLAGLAVVGCGWLAWLLLGKLKRYLERKGLQPLWLGLLMFAGPCLALAVGLLPGENDAEEWVGAAIFLPSLLVMVGTPVWMASVYAMLAWHLRRLRGKRRQLRLAGLLGILSWLAGYMAAWRFAVIETLEAYAALPTSPPSTCYVATAAARGHSWLVRAWSVSCPRGGQRRVNMQLVYLKCGELALQAVLPRLHQHVRKLYDRIGPVLARALCRPAVADLAYIGLKPAEWLVRLAMACLVPEAVSIARRLYR